MMTTKNNLQQKFTCAILCGVIAWAPFFSALVHAEETPTVKNATTVVGLKKKTTARILDNFKAAEKELLFDTFPISAEDELGIALQEKKKRSMEQVLSRLDNIQAQYKEQKKQVTKQKLTLKALIKTLDASIEEAEANIATLQNEIAQKNRQMSELTSKIDDLQTKIDSNKKALLEYVSYIYSQSDRLYDDSKNEVDIMKSVLLNDGSLTDVMSDIQYKTVVSLAGQNFIEMYRDFVKEFYYNKEKLKAEKKNQLVLRARLIAQNNELETQRAYKAELLEITKGQEALFNKYLLEKQTKENVIKTRIEKIDVQIAESYTQMLKKNNCDFLVPTGTGVLIDPSKMPSNSGAVAKCMEVKQLYEAETKLKTYKLSDKDNKFSWPVRPSSGISTYFRDDEYFQILGSEHDAIDIRVPQGTDIKAPAAGYVYFINPPVTGGYSYLAMKHSDGFVSVYGHLSEVLVQPFQFVEAGQIIAKSGGKKGTPGAGNVTSGPHLHYELYLNREPVDSLRFMDVSYLSYDSLPGKYRYKFIADLKDRFGNRANVAKYQHFMIVGANEMERQKDLLDRYAAPAFQDWDMWVEESLGAKLDPSFMMCIGLAESGLGRNLKTGYNVGNIGNTDSGGTMTFDSARDGVYWMGKTINNRFLGKYQTVDQLSRWGNKTGPIYASSPSNWHNNVIRCMSALKWRFVEDNFAFRVASSAADVVQ